MVRLRLTAPATIALAVGAALLCAAAAFLARRSGADPLACAGIVAAVALAPALVVTAALQHAARRGRAGHDRLRQLTELLEVSESEPESRALLLGHVQRLLPASGSAVLSRVESEDRLEATLGERISDTPLRGLVLGQPRAQACLAIRLGRPHERGPAETTLAGCELCGRLAGRSACVPLQAGGRMLGSLLVASVDPIAPSSRHELHEAAVRAAPLLALQRTVATSERVAARDSLTGLPNRRAAQDALARLGAQAGRTVTPLGAVLLDLDRFATVNDRFGHEHGDSALAIVARTIVAGVRASDFVARFGGQAFLVLAPDTGRSGAAELAEKLRREIEALALPGVGRITASCGAASVPEDAAAGDALLRRAEQALGVAKALGRNRVATPEPSPASGG